MRIAIYPGSFDPVTKGHSYIAERASRVFDKVLIAVAEQNYKSSLFSLEERMAFVADSVSHLHNCETVSYEGLTVELARKLGACAIIRGLRAISDYEYEMQVAAINKHLDEGIETVFFMSSADYSFISSTVIKQVSNTGAKISGLVTPMVEEALRKRLFEGSIEMAGE